MANLQLCLVIFSPTPRIPFNKLRNAKNEKTTTKKKTLLKTQKGSFLQNGKKTRKWKYILAFWINNYEPNKIQTH